MTKDAQQKKKIAKPKTAAGKTTPKTSKPVAKTKKTAQVTNAKTRKVVRKPKAKAKASAARKTVKKATSTRTQNTARTTTPNPTYQPMEVMMTKGTNQFEKIAQDATDFSREGFEAFQKSIQILAKGSEEMWKTAMSIAQDSAEKQQKYMKDAMGTKTLNEWADMQNKIAQTQFDDFMAGATKISELGVRTLTECSEPMNQQMTKAMNKANKAA